MPPEALSEWAHLCARALRLSRALPSDVHYCKRLATISARLSRVCLEAPLPQGLHPAAAHTMDECLCLAQKLANAASSAPQEQRAEHTHFVHLHENVDPEMVHTFSTATSLPPHLKLCPFTNTSRRCNEAHHWEHAWRL